MRAVSVITAVLLLVIVVIGATVALWLWLSGFAGRVEKSPAVYAARIEAAKIYGDGATFTIDVYVRNVGRRSVSLESVSGVDGVSVYVYDSYTGDLVYSNTSVATRGGVSDGNGNGVWEPGEILHVVASGAPGLSCGYYYDVRVVVAGIDASFPAVRAEC